MSRHGGQWGIVKSNLTVLPPVFAATQRIVVVFYPRLAVTNVIQN